MKFCFNPSLCGACWNFAAYCVVAKDSVGKQISIAFLERMKVDFRKRYGGGKADTAVAKSLNKEFGYVLKEIKSPDDLLIARSYIHLHLKK